jgi:hypothetical protein
VLLDQRFSRPSTTARLPGWIGKQLRNAANYAHAFREIRQFFANHSTEQQAIYDQRRSDNTVASTTATK